MTGELLKDAPGTGYDWIVNYSQSDGELGLVPIFDRATMTDALNEATIWLDGSSGAGTYEITGIVRRDIIGNADEMLGSGRLN